jgi:hypothetical protein
MPREVTDADGTTWSCVQLYANLSDGDAAQAAAERAADAPDHVAVVCTPSGGAQSVRVELPTDWEEATDDATLVAAIASARAD